jgi:hypothetical protein
MNDRLRLLQRQPRRITITLSYHVHEALLTRSEEEGRSVSNLCAFLLEDSLRHAADLPVVKTPTQSDSIGRMASYAVDNKVRGNGHFSGG